MPENRSDAGSRLISVKYVRFPATGSKKASPIIYLSGGPGGSGIMTAKYPNFRFPLFMALREFGDVIALDQRGSGASKTAPECTSSQQLVTTEVLTEKKVAESYRLAAKECFTFWKNNNVDILGYTTYQNALDLEALRQHLKVDKITLWGISYGSHLALAGLKFLPGKIDKVVIASAEGLNQTVKLPARTDAYFERLQQAINTQPKAAQRYSDIKGLIQRVHKKLLAKPILVKIPKKGGGSFDFLFQKAHMQILASGMISDPHRGVVYLLALYETLDKGSRVVLNEVLKRGYFNDHKISFEAMPLAMDVASGVTDSRLLLVNQQAKTSLLGKALNFPMPQLNKVLPELDLGDDFRALTQSDVPTLLLSGTLDGRTYIESQIEATSGLTNLTQVTVKNAGHNLFMASPEVTDVIQKFLKGEAIKIREIKVELPQFIMNHKNK